MNLMNATSHLFFSSTLWIALVMAGPAHAQQCTINVDAIDRGERTSVLICGAELSSDYVLDGLSGSGISALEDVISTSRAQVCTSCSMLIKQRSPRP